MSSLTVSQQQLVKQFEAGFDQIIKHELVLNNDGDQWNIL